MLATYIAIAAVVSLIEAAIIVTRLRGTERQGDAPMYAIGAGLMTFALLVGLANVVWEVFRSSVPSGGGGSPTAPTTQTREIVLNGTTLLAGGAVIILTNIIVAGAALAGVRIGQGTRTPAPEPVMIGLPETVDGVRLMTIFRALVERLDNNELANLAFDLGVDLQALPDIGQAGRARELLRYLHRRRELPRIVALLREVRPDIKL